MIANPVFHALQVQCYSCLLCRYDTCGCDPDSADQSEDCLRKLNCKYNGPPKPPSEEQVKLIEQVCPHLVEVCTKT
jgi:hypothetical protein